MIVPLDFLSGEHIPLNHWRGSPLLRDNAALHDLHKPIATEPPRPHAARKE